MRFSHEKTQLGCSSNKNHQKSNFKSIYQTLPVSFNTSRNPGTNVDKPRGKDVQSYEKHWKIWQLIFPAYELGPSGKLLSFLLTLLQLWCRQSYHVPLSWKLQWIQPPASTAPIITWYSHFHRSPFHCLSNTQTIISNYQQRHSFLGSAPILLYMAPTSLDSPSMEQSGPLVF